jgi:hypothetical protein
MTNTLSGERMNIAKSLTVASMSLVTMTALSARAQFNPGMSGTGYNMGQQGCSQPVQAGAGASSYLDGYREIQQKLAKEKKNFRSIESKQKAVKNKMDASEKIIRATITADRVEPLLAHMSGGELCGNYNYGDAPKEPPKKEIPADQDEKDKDATRDCKDGCKGPKYPSRSSNDADQSRMPASEYTGHSNVAVGGRAQLTKIQEPYTPDEWRNACMPGKPGGLYLAVCESYGGDSRPGQRKSCKEALEVYRTNSQEQDRLANQLEASKLAVDEYNEALPKSMQEAKDKYREDVEAGICMDCMARGNGYITERQGPDWAGVIANAGAGVIATGIGYYQNKEYLNTAKYIAQGNTNLGFPSAYPQQAYPTIGYGMPFFANAIYGALGGGTGSGTFGCAGSAGNGNGTYGNVGMNGPFGYPNGTFGGQMGGGMYNGGMSPFGIAGPWGLGNNMNGNPYAMNGMNGMPGLNPYGGMNGNGFNPYGGMNGNGFNPYGGMNGNGFNPYGTNPYGMNGMNGMGNGIDSQYQMAQQQLYMQQQQQQMQNNQVRQQGMMAIGQQMQELQQKLYMLQSGAPLSSLGTSGLGSSYLGAGFNVSAGLNLGLGTSSYIGSPYGGTLGAYGSGNPSIPIPAPASNGYNTNTVIPSTGVGGGVMIPAGANR